MNTTFAAPRAKALLTHLRERNGASLLTICFSSLVAAAATSALVALPVARSQSYSQFIVGSATWSDVGKQGDYTFLYSLPVTFFLWLTILALVSQATSEKSAELSKSFFEAMKWSIAVFTLGLISQVFVGGFDLLLPAIGSALLLLATILFALLSTSKFSNFTHASYLKIWASLAIAPFLATVSVGSISNAIAKLGLVENPLQGILAVTLTGSLLALPGQLLAVMSMLKSSALSESSLNFRLRSFLTLVSVGLPLGLLVLAPRTYTVDDKIWRFTETTQVFDVALGVVILCAYSAGIFQFFTRNKTLVNIFQALYFFGGVVFLKLRSPELSYLSDDDYHFGEVAVPGYLNSIGSMDPYQNIDLARGLINLAPSMASDWFFDGTIAGYASGSAVAFTFFLLALTILLSALIGIPSALALTALVPPFFGLVEIDIVISLVLLGSLSLIVAGRRLLALLFYFTTGILFLTFAPGQGALTIVSVGIGFVVSFVLQKPKAVEVAAVSVMSAITALLVFGPWRFFSGFLTYGIEQSAINDSAYGVSWAHSFGSASDNVLLFEFVRSAYILGPTILILFLLLSKQDEPGARFKFLVLVVPFLFLVIAMIPRASGRLDPEAISRVGMMTLLVFGLLLPVIMFYLSHGKVSPLLTAMLLTPVIALLPIANSFPFTTKNLWEKIMTATASSQLEASTANLAEANSVAINGLGRMLLTDFQMERIARLNRVVSILNRDSRDFLDLTNRSASYAYLRQVPPLTAPAPFNLVSEGQQFRSVRQLQLSPPKLILLRDNNIFHDGGPISLRTPILFAWLVTNLSSYLVFEDETTTWLVAPDLKTKFQTAGPEYQVVTMGENLAQSLSVSLSVSHLGSIPGSWGQSYDSLSSKIQESDLWLSTNPTMTSGLELSLQNFLVRDEDPWIRYEISNSRSDTGQLDLLEFDLKCSTSPHTIQNMKVYWSSNKSPESELNSLSFNANCNSRNVVPLYASMKWVLMADEVNSVRIDLEHPFTVLDFLISDTQLKTISMPSD